MGTLTGVIKVIHAPTLKTKFTCTLETEEAQGKRTILDILYVLEMRTVLVTLKSDNLVGEVWSFEDTAEEGGYRLKSKIRSSDESPCYNMVKVCVCVCVCVCVLS